MPACRKTDKTLLEMFCLDAFVELFCVFCFVASANGGQAQKYGTAERECAVRRVRPRSDHGHAGFGVLTSERKHSWRAMMAQHNATTTMECWNQDELPNLSYRSRLARFKSYISRLNQGARWDVDMIESG